jgi:type I restriction enzyme S subunit
LARTETFQQHTNAHSTGTTVLHLSKDAVPEYQFVYPDGALVAAYERIAKPIFNSINESIEQSSSLTQLRDSLLPKLLSGEIEVPTGGAA